MRMSDWSSDVCSSDLVLWDERADAPWYALPPLLLAARYYGDVVPPDVLARLAADCHPLLRMVSRRQTLTRVSSSELWLRSEESRVGIECVSTCRCRSPPDKSKTNT